MKRLISAQIFAAALLGAGLAGAAELPGLDAFKARLAAGEVPAPAAVPQPKAAAKEWTILVFINGKNNLSRYVEMDMNEMETVGSTDKINIVVEAGKLREPSYPDYPGGWNDYGDYFPIDYNTAHPYKSAGWTSGVRRYYVTKDNNTAVLGSQLLAELPKTDMGDWNHLAEFIAWGKANYPAKKYMVIVWNHGDGWKTKSVQPPLPLTRGISYDDETGNGITTVQLGQALAKAGGADIYASDACLMQMAEVVYELRDSASIVVGSEETEPGDGWDYAAFLSRVPASDITPEAMARAAVEGYSASYAARNKPVTMSAIRTYEMDNLRYQLGLWVVEAMKKNDKAKLQEALRAALTFEGVDSRDLGHFLKLAGDKLPELKAKGNEVSALISKMIVRNAPFGAKYVNASGLAAYLPSGSYSANYSKLAWAKAGNWDEFMQWLTAK
jgi:hypothetical protein